MGNSVVTGRSLKSDLLAAAAPASLVVFDYDGTLAHLAVDWDAVRLDLSQRASGLGFESSFRPLWKEMMRFRDLHPGVMPNLFEVLARHEAAGVERQVPRSEVLSAVEQLLTDPETDVAIFSANLHVTVKRGLAQMGLSSIRSIAGADDVDYWKPDPAGLLRLMDEFRVRTERVLFVGDSPGDAEAAAAAGVGFFQV